MSYEVEIKLRINNVDYVEKKLEKLGAELIDIVEEEDYYIDLTHCIDVKNLDIALRIRKSKSLMKGYIVEELTFKGKRVSEFPKIRKEITVRISDAEKLLEIFSELGFRNAHIVTKVRKVYTLGNFKILLDQVKELGHFMEIELLSPTNLSTFRDELVNLFKVINVNESCIERRTYLELLLERKVTKEIIDLCR
jgi:adenylate cyclase class 2